MKSNSKIDIVLVAPPTRATSQVVPISLLYLATYLESKGICSKIIDRKIQFGKTYKLRDLENFIADNILADNPLCVGFTCLTAEYFSVVSIAKNIRTKGYKGNIVVGGHHPTFCPDDFFVEEGLFDYVVLGEGENTLYELLIAISRKVDIFSVDGIAFWDGKILRTRPRELMEDLSILPLPSYKHLNMDYYLLPKIDLLRNILLSGIDIQTTRGCPFSCTFCGNHTLWSVHRYKKRFRTRPIKHVIREIEFLKDSYQIDAFYIQDDTFTVDEERVREFCDMIKEKNLNLIWGCQSHVNTFTETMAKDMKGAGCIQVEFGVESGSNRVLKEMRKGINVDSVRKTFRVCNNYKLRSLANFMINTPTERKEDLKATFSLANEIKATKYAFAVTVPLYGTELYKKYVRPGLKREEYFSSGERRSYQEIIDPRFRLAQHKKNIGLLYIWARFRYMIFSEYTDSLFWFVKNLRFYKQSIRSGLYFKALGQIYMVKVFNLLKRLVERIFIDHRIHKLLEKVRGQNEDKP